MTLTLHPTIAQMFYLRLQQARLQAKARRGHWHRIARPLQQSFSFKAKFPLATPWDRLNQGLPSDGPNERRGRKPCLIDQDKRILSNLLLHFADNGFPLSRHNMGDAIQLYVNRLPQHHKDKISFWDNRPGKDFLKSFLRRHLELQMRRRAALKLSCKCAMSANTLARHFTRISKLYQEYNITSPSQILNLDESGISTRTISLGN